jgi:hypothetical protein
MSRDEPQLGPSNLAMLDGGLHLEGWGPVHVALTDDAIIWERDKGKKRSKEVRCIERFYKTGFVKRHCE